MEHEVNIQNLESKQGNLYIETNKIDKSLERTIASRLIKVSGINWVENITHLPTYERRMHYETILNSINNPILAINSKGEITYQNKNAKNSFKVPDRSNIKQIFKSLDWAQKVDTAAKTNTYVNINTTVGHMIIDVKPIEKTGNIPIGAILEFKPEKQIQKIYKTLKNSNLLDFNMMVTENPAIKDTINRAKLMCNTQAPIIIYGESGTGKKTLAQSIHTYSERKNGIFSVIDCAIIEPSEIESVLFGCSGSTDSKIGAIELSQDGTLYIDSIHELSESVQNKLLKFINSQSSSNQIGLKIIAASTKSLKTLVDKDQFNKDLFYALDISHLRLPPLLDRKDEIEPLTQHFLNNFNKNQSKQPISICPNALNKILSYHWPGNINQLKQVIYNAVLVAEEMRIKDDDIVIEGQININQSLGKLSLPEAVANFEKHFLEQWYQKHSSTRKLASHLGVSHTTIAQKLNKYSIN